MKKLLAIILIIISTQTTAQTHNKYNVLLICIDDLRNELGVHGSQAITPNLDALAKRSTLFTNHYVQVPTCGASRFSMLTGIRPNSPAALSNNAFKQLKQKEQIGSQSFPELFRRSGYTTQAIGKISHSPDQRVFTYNGKGDGHQELPNAWNITDMPYGPWKRGWGSFFAYANGKHREDGSNFKPLSQFPDVPDNGLPDGLNTDHAIKALDKLKNKRFFLALGLYKPHLPFVAPKKYHDLYKNMNILPSPNPSKGNTKYWHQSGEFYKYDTPYKKTNPLTAHHQIETKKAYYACVSYADAQVGKILEKLKDLNLHKKTIVVVWGDHGWHLGDHAIWGKHNLHENAIKSTLIIHTPNTPPAKQNAIVESLDIYPTLINLCNTKTKYTHAPLDGQDLTKTLQNPKHKGRNTAISHWQNAISIRQENYHLIATKKIDKKTKKVSYIKKELYNHKIDPNETSNIAPNHNSRIKKMLKLIN